MTMTTRTIFCATLLILVLALGATSAQAQTQTGTQSDRSDAASPVKRMQFWLHWLQSRHAATGADASPIGFRLLPRGSGRANAGLKALVLSTEPLADTSSVKGSGTAGQIPKWVESRTLGDSVITELNGQIGIGTTTPVSKLTVSGASDSGLYIIRADNTGLSGHGLFGGGGPSGISVGSFGRCGPRFRGDRVFACRRHPCRA